MQQCAKWLSEHNGEEYNIASIKPIMIKPPAGMVVSTVEAPRGIMECVVYSDGSAKPLRVKWRTPSFYAVQVLPTLIKNHMFSDVMAIFGSLDVILPEVDR